MREIASSDEKRALAIRIWEVPKDDGGKWNLSLDNVPAECLAPLPPLSNRNPLVEGGRTRFDLCKRDMRIA